MLKEHPKGLWFLFFVEFWERFSFYGITALLVLYLSAQSGVGLSDSQSQLIAGSYLTYLYLTTAIGGIIADKLIGYQKAVFLGGSIIILGHICLTSSVISPALFFIGLGCISAGTGLFKANVSVMVGMLYDNYKPHLRSAGFSIFYAGINIGAAIATFVVGYIGEVFGWHYGFSLAAFGMAIGLITFRFGTRYLPATSNHCRPVMTKRLSFLPITPWHLIIIAAFSVAALFASLIPHPKYSASAIGIASVILLAYLLYLLFKIKRTDIKKIITILIMSLFMLFFWSLNDQIWLSLPLFIKQHVNHQLWGLHWQTTTVLAGYSIIIMLVNPFFAYFLQKFSNKNSGINTDQRQFGISLFFEAAAFVFISLIAIHLASKYQISIYWIFIFQFLLVMGELFISPIGLSLVTRLSPADSKATMMGIWWTISAYAGFIGGIIGSLTVSGSNKNQMKIAEFSHTYLIFGIMAFISGIILFIILPFLKHFLSGEKYDSDCQ